MTSSNSASSGKLKALAAFLVLAAAGFSIWLALGASKRSADDSRLSDLARADAQNLGNTIDYGIVALQETARAKTVSQALLEDRISSDRSDRLHEDMRNGLASAGAKALSMELLNSTGTVLACYPDSKDCSGLDMRQVPEIAEALRTRAETVGGFVLSPDGQLRISVVTPVFVGGNFAGLARMTLKAPGGKYQARNLYAFIADGSGTLLYHPAAALQGKRLGDALSQHFKGLAPALERGIAQAAKGQPEALELALPSEDGSSAIHALCSMQPVDTPSGRWVFALADAGASGGASPFLLSLLVAALAALAMWLLYRNSEAVVTVDGQPQPLPAPVKRELASAKAAAEKFSADLERQRKRLSETEERLASEVLQRKKTEEDLKAAQKQRGNAAAEAGDILQKLQEKQARLADAERAAAKAEAERDAIRKALEESLANKTGAEKKFAEIQVKSAKLEHLVKEKENIVEELQREGKRLETAAKTAASEAEKLRVQAESASRKAAASEAAAQELRKSVSELEKQGSAVKSSAELAARERDAAIGRAETAALEKAELEKKMLAAEAELDSLHKQCEQTARKQTQAAKEKEDALWQAQAASKELHEQVQTLKATVDALSRAQAAYTAAFDGAGDGMVLLVNGKAVLANATIGRLLGMKPEEVAKVNFLENMIPDPETQYYQTQDGKAPHKPAMSNFRLQLKTAQGQPMEFEASPSLTSYADGPALMLVLRPLLPHVPSARWRERASSLQDALIELDRNGAVVYGNAAAEALFQSPETPKLAGAQMYSLLNKTYAKSALASLSEALDGRAAQAVARIDRDGAKPRWARLVLWPVFDSKAYPPKVSGCMVLVSDVTAEKAAEQDLREREARLSAAVESSPYGILLCAMSRGALLAVQANPAADEIFGADLHSASASAPVKLLDQLPAGHAAKLESGQETSFEFDAMFAKLPFASRRKDGACLKISAAPLHGPGEGLFVLTVQDVSSAKASLEKAKASLQSQLEAAEHDKARVHEKLEQLQKDSEKTLDGVRTSAQSERKAAEDRLDAAKDRIAFLEHALAEKEKTAAELEKARYAAEKSSGDLEARAFADSKKLKQELEQTSQELRAFRENAQRLTGAALDQAKRLARFYETSPAAILIADRKGIITAASFQARKLLAGGSDITGSKLFDYAQDPQIISADMVRAGESAAPLNFEWELKDSSGRKFTAESRTSALSVTEGTAVSLMDVTERKAREQELLRSRGLLQSIFRYAPFPVAALDFGGLISEMNDSAAALLGVREKRDPAGTPFAGFVRENDERRFSDDLKRAFERGSAVHDLKYALVSRQNREFPVDASLAVYPDDNGNPQGLLLAFADASTRVSREEALRTDVLRFKGAFNSLPLFTVLESPDGKLLEANPAFLSLAGWTPEEAAARKWKPVFGIPEAPEQSGTPAALDAEFQRHGRQRRVLAWKASSVVDSSGDAVGSVWTAEDVTTARQTLATLEKERKLDRALFENSKDPMLVIDSASATVLRINREAELLLRVTSKEITGRTVESIIPPAYSSRYSRIFAEFLKEGAASSLVEAHICDSDGRVIPVEISAASVDFDGTHMVVAVMRDITVRREHENALSHAKRVAEEDARARAEFLAGMSQEIRVALSGLAAYANTLLRTNLNETQRDYVHAIAAGSENIITLAAGALDLSRLDAGVLAPKTESFDLEDLCQSLTAMFKLRSGAKTLRFSAQLEPNCPRFIKGDSGLVRRILINLVDNAIKFTEKGAVKLTAASAAGDKSAGGQEKIIFTVADTGAGMDAAELERAFDKFAPETGAPRLGLPVARSLAELMRGKLWAESKKGRGSRFYLELEFEPASPEQTPQAQKTLQAAGSVLVVEDNPINLNLARLMLENAGFEVTAAGSGTEAIELFKSRRFDFVFLDLEMPDRNGYDTVREMRRLENLSQQRPTPVAGLTAKPSAEEKERCLAFGMNDYLAKPLKANDMVTAISKWLGKGRVQD
ncbi:MAG: PAS domain S-box protein [Elusimicrobia bacterium]|nr:PAS domain S-box protein [Elusimicrobiota bacterium]